MTAGLHVAWLLIIVSSVAAHIVCAWLLVKLLERNP